MFDNLETALIQALGFFVVFSFFVYQTLFSAKKPKTVKKPNACTKAVPRLSNI